MVRQSRIDDYIRDRTRRGDLAKSSANQARWVLRYWERIAGPDPGKWTEDQAVEWALAETVRANTRKARLSQLRSYVRWLMVEGHLAADPTLRLGRVRVPDGDPRDLTVAEVGQLVRACPDDRARLVVLLMAQMGLRVGDVARIRVEDIDPGRRSLHVRAKGGRGEPTHWEPIPSEAWREVERALASLGTAGPLVRSQGHGGSHRGVTSNHLGRLLRGWMRAAGLKARPWDGRSAHSLRHSTAQHMLDGGADLREVQHALGHRTIRSTELYVRREPPGLRDAMEGRSYLGDAA